MSVKTETTHEMNKILNFVKYVEVVKRWNHLLMLQKCS